MERTHTNAIMTIELRDDGYYRAARAKSVVVVVRFACIRRVSVCVFVCMCMCVFVMALARRFSHIVVESVRLCIFSCSVCVPCTRET